MTIEKRTRGYEVLIRINADGTIGAHYATISEVIEDGEVIAASPPALSPLGNVSGENAAQLTSILGEFSTSIVSANEHLTATIADLQGQLEARSLEIQQRDQSLDAISAEFSGYRSEAALKYDALKAKYDDLLASHPEEPINREA